MRFVYSVCAVLVILNVFSANTVAYSFINEIRNVTRFKRQNDCPDGFQCKSTQECINLDNKCDGKDDCKDGSDENQDVCKNIPCPGYLFRCNYGACVGGNQKCDGHKDCKDNSDEENCVIANAPKVESNCRSDQFECNSGQCIDIDDKCNGNYDCEDKSDETKDQCFNIQCPGYTYKCAYGACVNGFAKCNNVKDCVDNSDEENCGPVTPVPPIIIPPTPKPDEPSAGSCTVPRALDNGYFEYIHNGEKAPQGDVVVSGTVLKIKCQKDMYVLSTYRDEEYAICKDGAWPASDLKCERLCPAYFSTKTTNLKCNRWNITGPEVPCSRAPHDTVLSYSCAPYYEIPPRSRKIIYCSDGTWDYPQPSCIQVCGEKVVSATPLIVNGKVVKRGNYPWVAALYRKKGDGFENICGGSLLTQKIVLTAAHCVTDKEGNARDPSIYKVAVGKYFNKYGDPKDSEAQLSEIDKVLVNHKYKADIQNYLGDIAILITKITFALSKVVQPVCFVDLNSIRIKAGTRGIITGWGYTVAGGEPSDKLKELEIPFKDDSTCQAELPPEWYKKYYTFDKMCGGYLKENTSVCRGDSGGGLVFKNPADDRFYVHGIVSVGPSTLSEGKYVCDIQQDALFTKVAEHYEWLEEEVTKRSKKSRRSLMYIAVP